MESLDSKNRAVFAVGHLLTTWKSLQRLSQGVDYLWLYGSGLWVQSFFTRGFMCTHHTGNSAARSYYAKQADLDLWIHLCVQNLISIFKKRDNVQIFQWKEQQVGFHWIINLNQISLKKRDMEMWKLQSGELPLQLRRVVDVKTQKW